MAKKRKRKLKRITDKELAHQIACQLFTCDSIPELAHRLALVRVDNSEIAGLCFKSARSSILDVLKAARRRSQ